MTAIGPISEHELTRFPILAALKPQQREHAIARARIVSLERGQYLFHQGDPAQRIWLCRDGQLKLFRLSVSGQEKIIALINPGRSFAEATLFMPIRTYPVHCAALTSSEVIGFDSDALVEVLRQDTEACFRLLATMSARMQQKLSQIESLALQNAHLRVAGYLLDEFRRHDQAGEFRLRASKKQIAGLLAIQPETLSRSLAQLKKDGVVDVRARAILVNRPDQLEKIVNGRSQLPH